MRSEQSNPLEVSELSVIVASAYSVRDLEICLGSLIEQGQGKKTEIIVADCCQDGSPQEMMAKYPDVIFIRFPEKTPLPTLWGAGIARSTGRVITITDSTCTPDEHWVAAILKAHESSHAVIGGAVEIGANTGFTPTRWVDWAAYFCDYGQFMHPLTEGVVNELPGNNVSFKRWTLKKGREFVENGFWKTYWCRKLQEEGIELMSSPSIVVRYRKSYRLIPFLVRRFHHGRCFAGMRIAQVSIFTRAFYVVGSPMLPFLFLVRMIKAITSKRRYLKEFALSFPISLLAIMGWSFGEFWGYITGSENSCAHIY